MDKWHLASVLPPPALPVNKVDWVAVQEAIGTDLPSAYRRMVETYGSGCIDGFLWLLTPTTNNRHLRLEDQVQVQTEALLALRGDLVEALPTNVSPSPESVPYPIFPEPGGLLPWLITDNGDVVYWATRGAPDTWSVVTQSPRAGHWQEFALQSDEWLAQLLRRELVIRSFPDDFPAPEHHFVPEGTLVSQ